MEKKYIIALDQGTTSCRAVIFDKQQNIVSMAQKEIQPFFPQSGWVEHDPMNIYAVQYGVLVEVLAKSGIKATQIAGIGITNQRETTIVWDKDTGRPIYNAIVWQCRRTASICEQVKLDNMEQYIKDNTGLLVDAYFSATKIKWLLDNVVGAREKADKGKLCFGTVDTWLLYKLTNGEVFVTDRTNASRTMLYNIKDLCWDKTLCDYFDIPSSMLPEVRNSSEIYGSIELEGEKIPVAGIAGDQQAALFGQTCFNAGDAKNTYGTGCFLLMNTGNKLCVSNNGLISTIIATADGSVNYALEGSIFVGGAVVQWIRDELGLVSDASDTEYFASKVEDNGGVYIVPAFTGLGAPQWDMYARGIIVGLTRGSNRNHIIRAGLESIAYQVSNVLDEMIKDTGINIKSMQVDGGASANNFLMQFQADIIDKDIIRPKIKETTALGAAYLAGLAVGFWKDTAEIKKLWSKDETFISKMGSSTRENYLRNWKKAVERSLKWEE